MVAPAVRNAPDSITPGQTLEVSIVGFSGAVGVELCGLTVEIDEGDAPGGVTVLTGTVPVLPGGTCDLVVTTAEASVTVEVDVVDLLSGVSVGYFVDDDGRDGEFRFTTFLQGLADADLFDLTLYEGFPAFEDFANDVAAETAPEVMFLSFSGEGLDESAWTDIRTYLETAQGVAVILTYSSIAGGGAIAVDWGLDFDIVEGYLGADVASFDIVPSLTAGNDAPLELTMEGFSRAFTFTTTGVEEDVDAFCTEATDGADPDAVCGVGHRTLPAALAGWVPEAMVGGQDDELLLQLARSLF